MPKDAIMQLTPGSFAVPPLKTAFAGELFREDFAVIGANLRARLDGDNEVLAPRAATYGQSAIDDWLQHYEAHFLTLLPELFFERYPGLRNRYKSEVQDLARLLLEYLREDLRRYALRRLAIRWSASRYPDAITIGEPEKEGDNYLVPVLSLRDDSHLGHIALTASGVVLPDAATGQMLREALTRAA